MVLTTSYLALGIAATCTTKGHAQSDAAASNLPPVTVTAPDARPRSTTPSTTRDSRSSGRTRRTQVARPNETAPSEKPAFGPTQDARAGTVGVYSDSTSTATKTNTRVINIPQSVTVLTKDYIRDQSFQTLTEATRYVPGGAIHQGEGNRDELVIRGVDSSANLYVNGFRDDVQYFRDLYKHPEHRRAEGAERADLRAGRGRRSRQPHAEEADGQRIYEATMQTGSYADKRVSLDAGQAVTRTSRSG
ncbi:hypothetical protein ES707_10792 [subsurface metagenome]